MFPGYSAHASSVHQDVVASDAPRSVDDLKVVRHERGEYGEAVVFGSDWLDVVFTRFGDSLLDVSLRGINFKMFIEAHPQPIDGYMKPVLFARPRLEFIDYTTIDRAMECYRGEAELVVEVCEFLRRQVDELFPDFIL